MAIKKTKKKATRAAKPAVAECACGADCKCRGCRCWKKIGIFVLGAVIGAAVCCAICCKKPCFKRFGPGHGAEPAFTAEGCLNLATVKDSARFEMIKARFGDKACITKADMFGGERPAPRPRRQRPQPAI